ncbi:MAG: hypothetical protein A3F33_03400 [Candidatus Woykebacteria bacterium RIFCSPHIGHO2_12_FULL_43_10]|uniref:Uncharacterized protein n=2 Tax=Candidatus Woykeibacteriota TaxID=1817899 RepID=A0A1G1WVR7_9BACT|nr:MAG: hypothetical protein A2802_02020 [Candidatus Woykebacteria bacterium RIFCSPHIGHO2_01_FULL_43_29]OGY29571.1 MAG: hypothetical protein A3F33_03400 [Candidatus Woykebacteria bacterium RIFCSPHIGHO2_12_FULL_43_10]OGY30194.1 MAG: hypothetical protein A3J50_01950 [Candidatus Woykebacteria bacterium RIFCSPHIGHO2_02_FULL_43_16b]OGY31856.1 MAG: hypothetical protein A3A61_03015 [Candidatus Woykebacteria bacterium RIFCSPLOWO2_01_FULL_43_14]
MDVRLHDHLFRNNVLATRGSDLNPFRGWIFEVVAEQGVCVHIAARERTFTWGDPRTKPRLLKVGLMYLDPYFSLLDWKLDTVGVLNPLALQKRNSLPNCEGETFRDLRLLLRFRDPHSDQTREVVVQKLSGSVANGSHVQFDANTTNRLKHILVENGCNYQPGATHDSALYRMLNYFLNP